jgi:hypothetical protein
MLKPAIFISRETAERYGAATGRPFKLFPAFEKGADKTLCLGFRVALMDKFGEWLSLGEPCNA